MKTASVNDKGNTVFCQLVNPMNQSGMDGGGALNERGGRLTEYVFFMEIKAGVVTVKQH
jgi:hypothetical protein